ncbi:MAG: hypothetical protein FJZ01_01390 [Candidatus Sericytochromatia bacterium]|nr:hypothetical protein [Candidatus Tanganyikabacteria bacterium]
MGEVACPDLKRISALVAESEWLVADDRWTEEEFLRLWRAAWQASAGQRDALEPLLAAADPAWRDKVLQARTGG